MHINVIHAGRRPVYMTDFVRSVADSKSRSKLRSEKSLSYVTVWLRTNVLPATRNSLPVELSAIDDPSRFKHIFNTSFFIIFKCQPSFVLFLLRCFNLLSIVMRLCSTVTDAHNS